VNPAILQRAYLDACEMELQAFKPGNVSIHSEDHDMTAEDFRRSAAVSAPYLADAALTLGEKIESAVRATRAVAGCNTNLGIVLLCAPMLEAALACKNGDWRAELGRVLANTSVADAAAVYRAIVVAAPGGLGRAEEQDVHAAPGVTLAEAMRLASGRDRIALQYVSGFADVFGVALPAYRAALAKGWDESWAAVAAFVALLRRFPDSHVERKFGVCFNALIRDRMTRVDAALSTSTAPESLEPLLRDVDAEFKSLGVNPGTSADLTVASLLAARLDAMA
jgi:triphosphoribosyl-dephospho-CoA synthase